MQLIESKTVRIKITCAHFLLCAGLDESESQRLNALTQATACANVL